jgi:hypothetical protein
LENGDYKFLFKDTWCLVFVVEDLGNVTNPKHCLKLGE